MDDNYNVYDGVNDQGNCTSITLIQWTYNVTMFLYGAASMYNLTHEQVWINGTNGLVQASQVFLWPYSNATVVMYEQAFEPHDFCNNDQFSFKANLGRWLDRTTKQHRLLRSRSCQPCRSLPLQHHGHARAALME
jgi:mannan endo-1,6-alpha-mannosidase